MSRSRLFRIKATNARSNKDRQSLDTSVSAAGIQRLISARNSPAGTLPAFRSKYPQTGDLNVYLYAPDGTGVRLLECNCGSGANVDTTFDDTATDRYSQFCPSEAGRGPFKGNEPLQNFNSIDSSLGVWRLTVENNGSDSRTGPLKDASLTITGSPQGAPTFRSTTVLNTASVRAGVIAPGQRITILGLALGPVTGVNTSAVIAVTTPPTFPSIYTFDQLGVRQAKAINQDGKPNSKVAPARTGEAVSNYASGLGAVAPASPAGQVGPSDPLSIVSEPVAASIGGVPAPVAFAGLAPGGRGLSTR